jgi:electron transport complex protein RnfD
MNRKTTDTKYPPFVHTWKTTSKTNWICIITILPVIFWSSWLYGRSAFYTWLICILSAIIADCFVSLIFKKITLDNGSALLTGLLVASAMPPVIPFYIPMLSVFFALFIVKACFGGLGGNWMNPALAGIAFAFANWPVKMRTFLLPRIVSGIDGVNASSPLQFAHSLSDTAESGIIEIMRKAGYPLSQWDISITQVLNDSVFSFFGSRIPNGYIDLSLGFRAGALGESALLVCILGSILLLSLNIIKFEIPAAIILSFSIMVRIFGTGLPGEDLFSGDILFALSNGGVFFASFYMATDPVSSPVGKKACIIYGIFIGVLTFLFRRYGNFTEGIVYAVLIANVFTPAIEKMLITLYLNKNAFKIHRINIKNWNKQ